MTNDAPNALLTTPEACEILKISEKTFRKLVSDGLIPRILIGKRGVRFDNADIQNYILGAKCQSIKGAGSGTTNSSSTSSGIAGPPTSQARTPKRKRKPSRKPNATGNVSEFPWLEARQR